ncbi:MAG: GDYXXLXY domain-containing protein, partial [Planctomycetaceae bacterium]
MSPPEATAPPDRLGDWIRSHQHHFLGAAVVFQVLVLMALIAEGARPWVTGETIRLRVIPVDPRDLFRGDYLILSYDFTTQSPPHMR